VIQPEQLGEMVVVHARIGRPDEREDLGTDGGRQPAVRGPAAVSVGHGGGAVATEAGQEATEMPYGQTQERGRFSGSDDPRLKPSEDVHAMLLLLVQGDRLPGHAPRVTKSLIRSGVTKSWSYYSLFKEGLTGAAFSDMLRKRFAKYGLELHEEKTRLIPFGRFAEENLRRQGQHKPPTFDFLGLRTSACEAVMESSRSMSGQHGSACGARWSEWPSGVAITGTGRWRTNIALSRGRSWYIMSTTGE
jgi:hypothetical protein